LLPIPSHIYTGEPLFNFNLDPPTNNNNNPFTLSSNIDTGVSPVKDEPAPLLFPSGSLSLSLPPPPHPSPSPHPPPLLPSSSDPLLMSMNPLAASPLASSPLVNAATAAAAAAASYLPPTSATSYFPSPVATTSFPPPSSDFSLDQFNNIVFQVINPTFY